MSPTPPARSTRWRIGTRGSPLALAQTKLVVDTLRSHDPDTTIHIEIIRTQGDVRVDVPLALIGGQGVFVTEIENALRDEVIDFAVHSAKDLPSTLAPDLFFAAVLPRGDARDCVVVRDSNVKSLSALPPGSRVGTSSPRRNAQLLHHHPALITDDVRGNVDSRLRKLDAGEFDALLLASAGLDRLGLAHRIAERIETNQMVPAVGQGIIAVQCRASDSAALAAMRCIDDARTRIVLECERAFLARLGAGCSTPAGAHAKFTRGTLRLEAFLQNPDGTCIRDEFTGDALAASSVGVMLADLLLAQATATSKSDTAKSLEVSK